MHPAMPPGILANNSEAKPNHRDAAQAEYTSTIVEEQEKTEKCGESTRTSAKVSLDHHEDEDTHVQDLEAIATITTNSPPYSVFTKRQKHFIVFMAACGGFFSPLSANIYFPALTTLTQDFNVSSTLMNLTLTSYMIFQGLAPTIFGGFSDMA